MAPAAVSGIAQALPLISADKQNAVPLEKDISSQGPGASLAKENRMTLVDTVNISEQTRKTITEAKKEEAKKEDTKKKEFADTETKDAAAGTMAKVEFVYDLKGDLIVKYMDNANRLIYQVPSELMLRMRDTGSRSDSSVDTRA